MTQNILQIKVTLLGTKPPIWRRLLVPADLSLAQLHNLLQVAMGWQDAHVHEFRAGKRRFGQPESADLFMRAPSVENERKVSLSAVLEKVGAKVLYTYDFGDNWEHSVVLEKQLTAELGITYPICTDGQLACPPEDCGGIPGYYDLLDVLADRSHERYDDLREWVGDDFKPQIISVDQVNRRLSRARRRTSAQ